jgi:hypothetical protein
VTTKTVHTRFVLAIFLDPALRLEPLHSLFFFAELRWVLVDRLLGLVLNIRAAHMDGRTECISHICLAAPLQSRYVQQPQSRLEGTDNDSIRPQTHCFGEFLTFSLRRLQVAHFNTPAFLTGDAIIVLPGVSLAGQMSSIIDTSSSALFVVQTPLIKNRWRRFDRYVFLESL